MDLFKKLLLVLLCTLPFTLFGQGLNYHLSHSVGVSYHNSTFFPSPRTEHLFQAVPSGVEIDYLYHTQGKKEWARNYNSPSWGITFSYYDYKTQPLGKMYGLSSTFNYNFLNFNRSSFLLKGNIGLAYTPNHYDIIDNNQNHAIGSPVSFLIQFGLGNLYHLSDRFGIHTQLKAVHFSNGGLAVPNLGLNILQLNLGVNYYFGQNSVLSTPSEPATQKVRLPLQLYVYAGVGGKAVRPYGSNPSPVYSLATQLQKQITSLNFLSFGLEGFTGPALKKDFAYYQFVESFSRETEEKAVSFLLGITAGHELLINKVALVTQLGYYLFRPLENSPSRFYQRSGLKYYWKEKKYALSLLVKTYGYGNSHSVELGTGIRL